MTTTTFEPSGNHDFGAVAAAEAVVNNITLPSMAAMKAEALASDLSRLPATTNHAARITEICSQPQPNLKELRQALLAQCRELTAAKERQTGAISRRSIGEHADRCLDIATDCQRAIESCTPAT